MTDELDDHQTFEEATDSENPEPQDPRPVQGQTTEQKKHCPKCKQIWTASEICPSCGLVLISGKPKPQPANTVQGQNELSKVLDEIEERANQATPGPWEFQTGCSWRRIGAKGDGDVCCPTNHPIDNHVDMIIDTRDGEFIASSRIDVPALVKALRRAVEICNGFADMASENSEIAKARTANIEKTLTAILEQKQ